MEGGGRSTVHRRGDVVIRDTGPWSPAVHALLRHLEDVGFAAAPRLVGSGLDHDGREVLTLSWRARSAAWMIRHRRTLETALTRGVLAR